jgi:hypothetical protein
VWFALWNVTRPSHKDIVFKNNCLLECWTVWFPTNWLKFRCSYCLCHRGYEYGATSRRQSSQWSQCEPEISLFLFYPLRAKNVITERNQSPSTGSFVVTCAVLPPTHHCQFLLQQGEGRWWGSQGDNKQLVLRFGTAQVANERDILKAIVLGARNRFSFILWAERLTNYLNSFYINVCARDSIWMVQGQNQFGPKAYLTVPVDWFPIAAALLPSLKSFVCVFLSWSRKYVL